MAGKPKHASLGDGEASYLTGRSGSVFDALSTEMLEMLREAFELRKKGIIKF
jgi:hypothetical protein